MKKCFCPRYPVRSKKTFSFIAINLLSAHIIMKKIILLLTCVYFVAAEAQKLQPGFNKEEYKALMHVSAQVGDSAYRSAVPPPPGYRFIYRSPEAGLKNLWDLWMNTESVPIISIRGTTVDEVSWLANFYAAMVPAKGELQLSKTEKFVYQLADNPRAAVHVGWLLSTAYLTKTIRPQIDSLYKTGSREMLIIGHSQGGAIAFLLTAYLYHLQKQNLLPSDIQFKTYCSAGPKPGNVYFAYEYEALTQGGWAYNVINSADWVPQMPVSIQTLGDFNEVNPFVNTKATIQKQSFFKRLAMNYAYGKLTKNNEKAVANYEKFLGSYVVKSVKKQLPGFVEPKYAGTNDYVRTGNTITLLANEDYYKVFPQNEETVFINHFHPPYLYLLNQLSMTNQPNSNTGGTSLSGTWELDYISGSKIAFEGLYPNKKPSITIDEKSKKITGTTSCNSFNGTVTITQNNIQFPEAMAMTRMMCPGDGEQSFLTMLKKVSRYAVSGSTLSLLMDDIAVMRFQRK